MPEFSFEYIDNDPLVLIKLINPLSEKEIETYAYVDTGSDTVVIPKALWDELEIMEYERTVISVVGGVATTWYSLLNVEFLGDLYENIVVIYQDEGDILLGRTIIDHYIITFDGISSILRIKK